MTEIEIREMIEAQNGICLFGCKEEIDALVKALHQKFEDYVNAEVRQTWDNAKESHKQSVLDARIE